MDNDRKWYWNSGNQQFCTGTGLSLPFQFVYFAFSTLGPLKALRKTSIIGEKSKT